MEGRYFCACDLRAHWSHGVCLVRSVAMSGSGSSGFPASAVEIVRLTVAADDRHT